MFYNTYPTHNCRHSADNISEVKKMGNESTKKSNGIVGAIIRLVINAIVLMVVAFFVPGFSIRSIWAAILAAIVISVLDYVLQKVFRLDASPFGRGVSGFIIAALILYLTKYIVTGFSITILGAVIGALLIGIIDAVIPVDVF